MYYALKDSLSLQKYKNILNTLSISPFHCLDLNVNSSN